MSAASQTWPGPMSGVFLGDLGHGERGEEGDWILIFLPSQGPRPGGPPSSQKGYSYGEAGAGGGGGGWDTSDPIEPAVPARLPGKQWPPLSGVSRGRKPWSMAHR